MKILISQKEPSNMAAYATLLEKHGADIDFHPFFLIEPLSDKDFRAQHINLQEHTAVIFTSRVSIDAYFRLCDAMRVKVPDTMKYFCTSEIIANYLQKHIVYRKRKIFFGDGTPESIVSLIGPKHKGEKFLLTATEGNCPVAMMKRFEEAGLDFEVGYLVKPVSQDLSSLDLSIYDYIVVYNPADIKSLFENHPDYTKGSTKLVSWGRTVVKAIEEAGLEVDIQGPTPEATSAAKAIELSLKK